MKDKSKVLIVDDQLIGRQLLETILFQEDYELFFAEDGQQALEMTKTHLPDLVLLDVMMPKLDGYEVCRRIRQDDSMREIPVIMVTALDDRDSRLQGFDAGANDYISKPIDRPELLARVKNTTQMNQYRKLLLNSQTNAGAIENISAKTKEKPSNNEQGELIKLLEFLRNQLSSESVITHHFYQNESLSSKSHLISLEKNGEISGFFIGQHPKVSLESFMLAEFLFLKYSMGSNMIAPGEMIDNILRRLSEWNESASTEFDSSAFPVVVFALNRNSKTIKIASTGVYLWKRSASTNEITSVAMKDKTVKDMNLGRAEDLLIAIGEDVEGIANDISQSAFWQPEKMNERVQTSDIRMTLVELI